MNSRDRSHLSRTFDGTSFVLLGEALALPTGLITLAFLTRVLGPGDYGRLTLAAAIVIWIEWSIGAMLGRATNRCVAETDDWRPAATAGLQLHLTCGAVAAVMLVLAADTLAHLLGDPSLESSLRWFALEIPLFCAAQAHIQVLIGRGAFRQRAAVGALRWIIRMLLVLLFVGWGRTVHVAIWASIATCLVELLLLRRLLPISLRQHGTFSTRRLLGYAAPLLVSALCLRILSRIDLLAFKFFGANAEQAGEYGMAQNLAAVPNLLTLAFAPLLQSTLVRMNRESLLEGARELTTISIRAVLMALPVAAIASANAEPLARVLSGTRFAGAGPVLSWLILAAVGGVLSAVGAAILVGFDHPRSTAWIALPITVLAIVLLPLVVPRWGAIGAAGTTLLCSWLGAAAFVVVALRRVGARVPVGTMLRTALISVAGYGAVALINATITPRDWVCLACAALLVCAVPFGFRLLGEFNAEEWNRLRAALTRLDLFRAAASRR